MQKLTSVASALAVILVSPLAAQDGPITTALKTVPTLPAKAAAAPDAASAAAILRAELRRKLGRMDDERVVTTLLAAADALIGDDRYAQALRLGEYARSITIASNLGPGLLFDSLTRTGSALYNLDDYDGAARDLDAARKAAALIEPFDANSVANATANYAVVLDNAGRYREAEAGLREAIELRARAVEHRPASIAVAWSALAAVHKRMGRHDLSEQDYRTALAMLEEAKLTAAPTYAMTLHNYGVLMGEVGRDAEATALYRRALALRPADARFAPSMVNNYTSLSAALIGLGQLDEAEAAVRDAEKAAAGKTKPDTGTINVLSARADLAGHRGDRAEAERTAAAAVAQTRQIVAPDSIRLADVLLSQSDALRRNGKLAAARIAADEAVGISAALPDRNPLKALAQDTRAAALFDLGDPAQALAASRAAAETQARRFADEAGRTPAPLQIEERGVIQRRLALLWDASRR